MSPARKQFDESAIDLGLDVDLVERSARTVLALVEEVRRLRAALEEAIAEADSAYDDTGDKESWATRSSQLRALVGVERKP